MNKEPESTSKPISLAPLTTEEALSAVLRVKPGDLAKREKAYQDARRIKKTTK